MLALSPLLLAAALAPAVFADDDPGLKLGLLNAMYRRQQAGTRILDRPPLLLPGESLPRDRVSLFADEEEVKATQTRLERLARRGALLRAVDPRPSLRARGADGIDVGQGQGGVTRAADGMPRYLQSAGAGPCVILILFDHKTKTASMAHLDAGTGTADSIVAMLRAMKLEDGAPVSARLIGGNVGLSDDVFLAAIRTLDKLGVGILELDRKPIDGRPPKEEGGVRQVSDDIVFDVETGRVYDMDGEVPKEFRAPKADLKRAQGLPVKMIPKGALASAEP